jgi:rRNA maturation endonuclease Nob1
MLTCPKCQIDYPEGKNFCKKCGTPLELKREVPPEIEGIEKRSKVLLSCPECKIEYEFGKFCKKCGSPLIEQTCTFVREEAKPVLVCPNCKLIFESGKFCRKCGVPLVEQISPERDELKAPPPEVKKEVLQTKISHTTPIETGGDQLVCPSCKMSYQTGKFCKKCGSPLVSQIFLPKKGELKETVTPEVGREAEKADLAKNRDITVAEKASITEELAPTRIPEKPSIKGLLSKEGDSVYPSRARERFLRPLPIAIIGIVVLIAIGVFFLWPKYSYLIKEKPSPVGQVSKGSASSTSSPQTSAPTSVGKGVNEVIAIKRVLENIRQANLQKNINLFMSCYSPECKDLEGRKKGTLENWEKFDYSDLLYDLKSQTISGDTANIRVEWIVKYCWKGGGQTQETKSLLDVTLKKENGVWKIQHSKSAN